MQGKLCGLSLSEDKITCWRYFVKGSTYIAAKIYIYIFRGGVFETLPRGLLTRGAPRSVGVRRIDDKISQDDLCRQDRLDRPFRGETSILSMLELRCLSTNRSMHPKISTFWTKHFSSGWAASSSPTICIPLKLGGVAHLQAGCPNGRNQHRYKTSRGFPSHTSLWCEVWPHEVFFCDLTGWRRSPLPAFSSAFGFDLSAPIRDELRRRNATPELHSEIVLG